MHTIDKVRRRIDGRTWERIRYSFGRTVEFSRLAINDSAALPRYQAARDVLLESLGYPLTAADLDIVRTEITDAAVGELTGAALQNKADRIILRLGISL